MARDKANLDIFWLRDENLDDAASLEAPDLILAEIIDDLRTPLEELAFLGRSSARRQLTAFSRPLLCFRGIIRTMPFSPMRDI